MQWECLYIYPQSGADPGGGGWIGCLVTPLECEMSTETMNYCNQVSKKDFNMYVHGIQWESIITIASVLHGGRGCIPFPHPSPLPWPACTLSHPHSKISGSATATTLYILSIFMCRVTCSGSCVCICMSGADPGGCMDWVSSHPPKSLNVDET